MTGPSIVALCAGAGMLEEGLRRVVGGTVVAYAEVDPAACKVLASHHPGVPNLGDVTTVDWHAALAELGRPDWVTAGFPCTDLSHAGLMAGLRPGTRSGLWFHIAYAISVLRPRHVLIENVRGLLSGKASRDLEPADDDMGEAPADPGRALGVVLGDLADLGFDAEWVCLYASDAGAAHGRPRVFLAAEDADREPGGERRLAAPGQAQGGRARADAG